MNKFLYRKNVVFAIFISIIAIYIIRLFYMQIMDDSYKIMASSNSQRIETQYPARGLIFDRNRKLLVENESAYDLMIIPRQVKDFDTTELITILDIEKETLVKSIEKCKKYSRHKASILISQITSDKYAILQEKLHKYKGFFVQTRTLRKYNVNHSADVFGYIGEVSPDRIKKDSSYSRGDYIGISGLERSFEKDLRGKKGQKIVLVDNFNRIKGNFKEGQYDVPAIVGEDLITTLDSELQEYAYKLMQNKKGGIIAIEPQTGEILLKLSCPGYDPKLMVGLQRGRNYGKLSKDPAKPLFDRTVMAAYPPGSTFKTLQALIGQQEGVINESTCFSCASGASFGSLSMKCHAHPSPLDLAGSVANSCNPYYVHNWRRILENNKYKNVRDAYGNWREIAMSFGLGQKICPDFYNELSGSIPSQEYFDRRFRTQNWRWSYIMSISIGQGELLITPLQIANMVSVIANRGYYMTPHIVRDENKVERHNVEIRREYFEPVIKGMSGAVNGEAGTARVARVNGVEVCGKTGTVQNPHGDDHSVFMAFAPRENPKIAIAVYVENGVWGGRNAAPIASLLIEKYLNGEITAPHRLDLEKRMMETNLMNPKGNK
ncbi:MAG: penicillin-binding protein 2 [Marinifilaceae bacterium]